MRVYRNTTTQRLQSVRTTSQRFTTMFFNAPVLQCNNAVFFTSCVYNNTTLSGFTTMCTTFVYSRNPSSRETSYAQEPDAFINRMLSLTSAWKVLYVPKFSLSSFLRRVENVSPAATLGDDDDEAVSPQSMEDSTAANYMNQTLLYRAVWNDDTDTVRLAVLTGHHYTRLSRVDIRKWWSSC